MDVKMLIPAVILILVVLLVLGWWLWGGRSKTISNPCIAAQVKRAKSKRLYTRDEVPGDHNSTNTGPQRPYSTGPQQPYNTGSQRSYDTGRQRSHSGTTAIRASRAGPIGEAISGTPTPSSGVMQLEDSERSYRAVAIKFGAAGKQCRSAALLRGKRFLLEEAPPLPLLQCQHADLCECGYLHFDDRRVGERRDMRSKTTAVIEWDKSDRRSGKDRRQLPGIVESPR